MPFVTVRGVTLHYDEAGSGPPLVLLHGGLGTAQLHWWREIPFFAEQFHVIAPDLRGYGRSSPPRDFPLDFYQRDAADMAALLDALGLAPAHVVGWSDGAIVALVLAARHPAAVRRLITIAGEARLLPEERTAWAALVDTSTWGERARQRFIAAHGPANWPGILDRMLAGYTAILEQAGGEIISRELHQVRSPTLILHGTADPTVPAVHAYELQGAIAGAEMVLYPGAGHLPHREHEAGVRGRITAFLTAAEQPRC